MGGDGSPTPRKQSNRSSVNGAASQDSPIISRPVSGNASGSKRGSLTNEAPMPLTTSKLGNQSRVGSREASFKKLEASPPSTEHLSDGSSLDNMLAKLSEQQVLLEQQQQMLDQHKPALNVSDTISLNLSARDCDTSSSGSIPITPASDSYVTTTPTDTNDECDDPASIPEDVSQLKKELEAARTKIARMDEELHQTRITNQTLEQAMGPVSEIDFPYKGDVTEQTISNLQNALNASRPLGPRQDSWPPEEDTRSNSSEPLSASAFNRSHGIWGNAMRSGLAFNVSAPTDRQFSAPMTNWSLNGARPYYAGPVNNSMTPQAFGPVPLHRQNGGNPRGDNFRGNQYLNEPAHYPIDYGLRRSPQPPSRPGSGLGEHYGNGWAPYAASLSSTDGTAGLSPTLSPVGMPPVGIYPANVGPSYPARPIGGPRLSPTAAEFNALEPLQNTPWNNQSSAESASTYVAPVEPMNYRRLLDRNMNCNWKYIVDKIVCNNDQQASIFLQQKLKVGTAEQKFEIVEAIIAQAYPLMINRFGNFLVQRCFEHGTSEQVIAIANAIRGNTLALSMDAFGCHVVQKAFDAVPEEYKAIMVHELLRRIPETVIHRYACHVWQKLFELRWSDAPPQIMKYVNESLRGMWHEVALGETGSLVVQNIFENCLEEDKRPCINEVLASIDVISHGQFGNWCIQHICEHGAPADRSRAIDHILRFATEYSMDQYASKVIEKCLKIGGPDFLERYLERVCEGRPDRPRMPLIDIAGDQFGNYLIQYILTHAGPQHRELVATHVRKHMVSLRGSKYGSRVAMLCTNPISATRPGPPVGLPLTRYNSSNSGRSAYGTSYR